MDFNRRKKALLLLSTLLLLAISVGWWSWQERHQLLPKIVNRWLDGAEIQTLQNLQIKPGEISAERIEVALENGIRLQLDATQLQGPLQLLTGFGKRGSRLTIAQLTLTPPHEIQPPQKPAARMEPPQAGNGQELRLSLLLHQLRDTRLQQIEVDKLLWAGATPQSGQLTLHKLNGRLSGKLQSGAHRARLELHALDTNTKINLQVLPQSGQQILQADGELRKKNADSWLGEVRVRADLQALTEIPLLASLLAVASDAKGELAFSASLQLPDQLLELVEYRDISAELSAKSLHFSLPDTDLGVPLNIDLSTEVPLALQLETLKPLLPRDISGAAKLSISPAGSEAVAPLLQTRIETLQSRQKLSATGILTLEAAAQLLISEKWQEYLGGLQISEPKGELPFQAELGLASLEQLGTQGSAAIQAVEFQLLEGGEANATLADSSNGGLQQMGWKKGSVKLKLRSPLDLGGTEWPGQLKVQGEEMQIIAKENSGTIDLSLAIKKISCQLRNIANCTFLAQLKLPKLAVQEPGFIAEQLSANGTVNFSAKNDENNWKLESLEISAQKILAESSQIDSVSLTSPAIHCTQISRKLLCNSDSAELQFISLEVPDMKVSGTLLLDNIQIANEPDKLSAKSQYSSRQLDLNIRKQYRGKVDIGGNLDFSDNRLRGKSEVDAGPISLNIDWQHTLDTGQGFSRFALPKTTFSRKQPLSSAIQGIPLDLVAGDLSAEGLLSWPAGKGDYLRTQFNELAATVGDAFATGIVGELALKRDGDNWYSPQPQAINLQTLDPGLPITDVAFKFGLNRQQDLVFEQLRAALLDGSLSGERLLWNLNGERREGTLTLSGISLRALTRELDAENFAATGTLDARIPLITDSAGITVEQGHVEARPPGGRLRYYGAFSADMLSSNPQLKLLAGALEDYNYRELSGDVEYPPNGDMQLQLKLVGRSSSVAADRDLIINLNLENNIPSMLRSLQASRDLTDALEKQIR